MRQKSPVILSGAGSAPLKNLPQTEQRVASKEGFFFNLSGISKLRTHICRSSGRRSESRCGGRCAAWEQGLMKCWCEALAHSFLQGRTALMSDTLGQDNLSCRRAAVLTKDC